MRILEYILKPDFFSDDCLEFYRKHYWLWCLRMKRIRCLLGFHKWIDCGRGKLAYCDNCPKDRDIDGSIYLEDEFL